jgi:hypothetical protein
MSQDRFGETTRRAFLGTATAATAASLTAVVQVRLKASVQIMPSGRSRWRKLMWISPHS